MSSTPRWMSWTAFQMVEPQFFRVPISIPEARGRLTKGQGGKTRQKLTAQVTSGRIRPTREGGRGGQGARRNLQTTGHGDRAIRKEYASCAPQPRLMCWIVKSWKTKLARRKLCTLICQHKLLPTKGRLEPRHKVQSRVGSPTLALWFRRRYRGPSGSPQNSHDPAKETYECVPPYGP